MAVHVGSRGPRTQPITGKYHKPYLTPCPETVRDNAIYSMVPTLEGLIMHVGISLGRGEGVYPRNAALFPGKYKTFRVLLSQAQSNQSTGVCLFIYFFHFTTTK